MLALFLLEKKATLDKWLFIQKVSVLSRFLCLTYVKAQRLDGVAGSQDLFAKSPLAGIRGLAVAGDVQALALVFFADTQAQQKVNQLIGHQRHHT